MDKDFICEYCNKKVRMNKYKNDHLVFHTEKTAEWIYDMPQGYYDKLVGVSHKKCFEEFNEARKETEDE